MIEKIYAVIFIKEAYYKNNKTGKCLTKDNYF